MRGQKSTFSFSRECAAPHRGSGAALTSNQGRPCTAGGAGCRPASWFQIKGVVPLLALFAPGLLPAASPACNLPRPPHFSGSSGQNLHLTGRRGPPSLQRTSRASGWPRWPGSLPPISATLSPHSDSSRPYSSPLSWWPSCPEKGKRSAQTLQTSHTVPCRPRRSQRSARLSPRVVPAPTQRQTFSPSHLLRDVALETSVFPTTLTSYFLNRELNLSHKYTKMLFPM